MTTEEKAKAYDEALKRAKKLYNEAKANDYTSDMEDYETIFPKLKSEDEKIRKEIIAFIKKRDRSGCDYDYDKWLAWLEKQKDISSAEYVFRPFAGCDIESAAIQAVEQQKLGNKIVLAFNGAYIPVEEKTADDVVNEYYSWLEKQGNQKIVDKVEPTPIFRVGDTLKRKGKDYTFVVDRIQGGYYHCDHSYGAFFPIEEQDNWELVEQK